MLKGVLCLGVCLAVVAPMAMAQNFLDENFGVSVQDNVVYGQGAVNAPSPGMKNLLADIYQPTGPNLPRKRPALIVVHGGLWRFGDKEPVENTDVFDPGRPYDTEGVYAREFAKRGYVCMSIDYRLVGDQPPSTGFFNSIPGINTTSFLQSINTIPPAPGNTQSLNAIEAAVADVARAVQWLRLHANDYDVDRNRIAIGGWQAGAITALLAAYAGDANVAAVWSNSGGLGGNNFLVSTGGPAAILFHGDSDGTVPVTNSRTLNSALDSAGVANAYYEMPGEDHYYTRDVLVDPLPTKGTLAPLEDVLAEELHAQLDLASLEADNALPLPLSGGPGMVVMAALLGASGILVLQRRMRPAEVKVRK